MLRLPDDHFLRIGKPEVSLPRRSPGWLHTLSADGSAPTRTFTTVALFFNLDTSQALTNADSYIDTPASAVAPWLAVGTPNRSGFINRYWSALSFGKLQVSVAANTDKAGNPGHPHDRPQERRRQRVGRHHPADRPADA